MRQFTRWRNFAIAVVLAIGLIVMLASLTTRSATVGTQTKPITATKTTTTSLASAPALHSQTPSVIVHSSGATGVRDPIVGTGTRSSPATVISMAVVAITITTLLLLAIAYMVIQHPETRTKITALISDRKRRFSVGIEHLRDQIASWYTALRGLPAGRMSVMAAPTPWSRLGRLTT